MFPLQRLSSPCWVIAKRSSLFLSPNYKLAPLLEQLHTSFKTFKKKLLKIAKRWGLNFQLLGQFTSFISSRVTHCRRSALRQGEWKNKKQKRRQRNTCQRSRIFTAPEKKQKSKERTWLEFLKDFSAWVGKKKRKEIAACQFSLPYLWLRVIKAFSEDKFLI